LSIQRTGRHPDDRPTLLFSIDLQSAEQGTLITTSFERFDKSLKAKLKPQDGVEKKDFNYLLRRVIAGHGVRGTKDGDAVWAEVWIRCFHCRKTDQHAITVPREQDLLSVGWTVRDKEWACPSCSETATTSLAITEASAVALADGTSDHVLAVFCTACTETRPNDPVSRQLQVTDLDLTAANWRPRDDGTGWVCSPCRVAKGELAAPPMHSQLPQPGFGGLAARLFGPELGDPNTDLAVRSRFPEFEVERLIARGGMGTVLLATYPGGEAPVALKLLSTRFRVRPEYQARFRAEIAALKALDDPNVVRLLDHRTDGSVDMLVMEYVEGKSVRDELTDNPDRVSARAVDIAIAVCEALTHAHERGIVHRDIKPSNVMLTTDGGIKVLDFGIAKLVHGEEGLTGTGDVLGSIGYLAPEIRSGSGAIDHRADVFSLGVTLHEMLNGRRPKVVDGKVVVGETAYRKIIERATQRDPDHRFSSCRELWKSLADQKAAAGDPA
jgi:hypothetical protein